MRWCLSIFALFLVMTSLVAHADLEDRLNSRWRGAWVIVNGELYSNCDSTYTNNRVSGDLISGNGRVALPTGELAKVRRVDVKRRRVDVFLDLKENVLIEYQEGPFTLYREASCRVELLVDTAGRTKKLGTGDIEVLFALLLERYARLADAEHSPNWNAVHAKRIRRIMNRYWLSTAFGKSNGTTTWWKKESTTRSNKPASCSSR